MIFIHFYKELLQGSALRCLYCFWIIGVSILGACSSSPDYQLSGSKLSTSKDQKTHESSIHNPPLHSSELQTFYTIFHRPDRGLSLIHI